MKYLESTLNWHWKYYIVPVDFRLSENAFIENHLSLPDGISVRSDEFKFYEY